MDKWKQIKANNQKYIPQMGSDQEPAKEFASIRSWGDKNSAITHDGIKVERQEYMYAEEYGLVKCAPYELHFIFEDKSKKKGRWTFMCTCGSIAGIISWKEVASLMSIQGEFGYVLACISHTDSKQKTGVGRHADNSTE